MWKKLFWGKKLPRRTVFAVGLYTIGHGIYDLTNAAVRHNSMDELNHKQRYGDGTVAVITGAASSTGEAFAEKLHKNGFKLALVDQVGSEGQLSKISEKYGDSTKVYTFDFANETNWQAYEKFCKQI